MRISGGYLKGRLFFPPAKNWPTRPTTDIAREALFNILTNFTNFEDVIMLDLFGGTGAHSYEMISRGCKHVMYVDNYLPCIHYVKEFISMHNLQDKLRAELKDYQKFIKSCQEQFNYIFAGPPYDLKALALIPDLIFEYDLLRNDGIFVLEHNPHYNFASHSKYWQSRNYGQTIFSFFRH